MSAKQEQSGAGDRALFIDLEYVAFDGFARLYKRVAGVLKGRDIACTPVVFARTFLAHSPARGIDKLLQDEGRERLSSDKLLAELQGAGVAAVSEGDVSLRPGVAATIKAAQKHGLRVGVITRLDADRAGRLTAKLGLDDKLDAVEALARSPFASPTSDCWLRLARSAHVVPRGCVAVSASAKAARTALYAAMTSLVVPSVCTAFDDYGGADAVLDAPSELKAAFEAALEANS